MKANYIIHNHPLHVLNKVILVSNCISINTVVNRPCLEYSALLNIYSVSNIGAWKIKKLK